VDIKGDCSGVEKEADSLREGQQEKNDSSKSKGFDAEDAKERQETPREVKDLRRA
jgi:hypothetical protein